jgi:hypothetical protein
MAYFTYVCRGGVVVSYVLRGILYVCTYIQRLQDASIERRTTKPWGDANKI